MKPCRVWICLDRLDAKDGMVWAVRAGRRWLTAHTVHIWIDVETVFKGRNAKQPKAYLAGFGYVRYDGHGTITIAKA